jgi:putative aldouronate transport system permease protein
MDKKNSMLNFTQVSPATNVVFNAIMIALALVCIVPMLLVLPISFSSEESLREYAYRMIPRDFSLEGYAYLVVIHKV